MAILALPASGAAGGPTTTHNVQPTELAGNRNCGTGEGDFEIRVQSPGDQTIPINFGGVTGSLTIDVYNTASGQAFDFSFSGGFGVELVYVKAGPNTNQYDYLGDLGHGVSSDTFLHGPVNASNGQFYGLSHISFCVVPLGTELQIVKTAVDDEITVGEAPQFDITVTNVGPVDATNVDIDDTLPTVGSPWTDNKAECTVSGGVTLHCDIASLAPAASFTVRVTGTAVDADDCGETLNNTAFADADNADQVQDSDSIDVICGAIEVNKVVKDATTETIGDTKALAGVGFTLFEGADAPDDGSEVAATSEVTTDASGIACFDGLPVDTTFTLRETTTPAGYATVDDQNVTTGSTHSECGDGNEVSVTIENDPLTDLFIHVEAQVDDATRSSIVCVDENDNVIGQDPASGFADPAEVDVDGLLPGTYTCTIIIDP
jgi:uncharacterized repeat protein (TIGR01451 family)